MTIQELTARGGGGGGGTPANYAEVQAAALGSRAFAPAIEFPAPSSRATGRLVVSGVVDLNPGAGPVTLWWRGRLPGSLATTAGICGIGPDTENLLNASTGVSFALGIIGGDVQFIMGNGTTRTTYALGAASLVNQEVDIHVTRSGSTLAVYLNGTSVTLSPVNTGAGFTPDTAINGDFYHNGARLLAAIGSNNVVMGPCRKFVIYNRALSAADVLATIRDGVDVADQWGVSTQLMNSTTLNGSFNDAGAGGADAFAIWSEGSGLGATVYDTTVTFAPGASCRFDVDANPLNSFRNVFQNNVLAVGKRYRIVAAFRHNQSGSNLYPYMTGFASGVIPQSAWSPASVAFDTWREFTAEFVATSPQFGVARCPHPSGAHSQWYDEIRLLRVGAIVDLQFDGTCGFQIADRANQRDGTTFNGAAFTLPDATRGFARWVAQVPGGEAIGSTSAIVIPTDCSISRVVVRNINIGTGQTFSLGSASGSLTNIINGAALGGNGSVTVIDPGLSTSSTGQLWVSYSGTGSIEVTVLFERF